MINEQQITQLLNRQDKQAISILYDRYAASLYGVALKIVHSEEVAEDILQDVFIKAWQKGVDYDSRKGSVFTWLLNITRNRAIDITRSSSFRKQAKILELNSFAHESNNGNGYTEELNVNQIGLRWMVNQLDLKYQKVIELVYFQGFTQSEVVEQLGIPLGTVKTRLKIGLREMRKFFEDTGTI
ncbi:MAG: sigma-70 family RNA polymerase sigma factor [Bacteroidota bacterium]